MSNFSEDDLRILAKTTSVRDRLLDNLLKGDNLPNDTEGVAMFRDLLDSMDKSVFNKAKIKVDDDRNKINSENKEILKEIVRGINPGRVIDNEGNNTIPVFQPTGTVTSSLLIMGKDEIDPDPYIEQL